MHNRDKSVFSVIDATPGQHDCDLPLWGLAASELWEKNNNEGNKYKEIELYKFVNSFPIEEFKTKFFNEFEIYKKSYPNGTIETFIKKEYQQFIYDCGDMIEMFDKQDYYSWTTVRGFDFYLQQMESRKKAYILEKNDIHEHEINLKSLLEFINNPTKENNKKTISKKIKYSFDCTLNKHQIEYLYTNYFSIYFDCTLEDIYNLFSEDINIQITINKKINLIDVIYFFNELVEARIIKAKQWQNAIVKTKCLIFNNNPINSDQTKESVKRLKKSTRDNETINLVERLLSDINR